MSLDSLEEQAAATSRHASNGHTAFRRAVTWVIAAALAVHGVLVLLWVAPGNPMRDAVGTVRLANYINPHWEQSWSVFAPTPRRISDSVRIRAVMKEKGKEPKATEWVDVTADVTAKVRYDMTPARIEEATRRLGARVNGVMFNFNATQRELVKAGYITTSTKDLAEALNKTRGNGRGTPDQVQQYITADESLRRFATAYASARWDGEVQQIQYLVGYQMVPAYASRNEVKLSEVPVRTWITGWRGPAKVSAAEQRAFDSYVKSLPK